MKIIVEKVSQSPMTPVREVAYLVKFVECDEPENHELNNLVRFLEDQTRKNIGEW